MEERQRLTSALDAAEQRNRSLETQLQSMHAKLTSFEQDKGHIDGPDLSRSSTATSVASQLHVELEQAQRDLDIKSVEAESLQENLQTALQRCDGLKLQQARLEVELQQMTDELDLARDSAKRLAQAEASIEKYQRRVEELNAVKKQNKDLEQKMEEYLDKIHELESGNKSIAALNKKIEQYKNDNVCLDREKMEALSALIGKEKQIELLQHELKVLNDTKKVLESELDRAK
jgi:chromosome segregation ATPase